MKRNAPSAYLTLPWAGAGLVLVLLMPLKALGLAQGTLTARLSVSLILMLLAALSLLILSREKYPRLLVAACLFPVALALFLRLFMLDHLTADYTDFLAPWVTAFREGGGFRVIRENIGNYNAPYLYFLAAFSYLRFPDLYAIKLLSILFDVLLAWGGLRLARLLSSRGSLRPIVALCLLLFLPTVLLNGAYWGQCDSIYTAFLLHALACGLDKRPAASLLWLAFAFSFKLQAIFLIPLWCILWYTGRVKFRHLLLFPVFYTLTITPALLLGKPLADILGVYLGQMGEYTKVLTLNAPSVFALLPRSLSVPVDTAAAVGIAAAFALVLLLLILLFPRRKHLSGRAVLLSALLLALGVPFLLPFMHERYFFAADALTLVLACVQPWRLPYAAGLQAASLGGYHAYLRMRYVLPITLFGLSFPMGGEAAILLLLLGGLPVLLKKEIGHNDQ